MRSPYTVSLVVFHIASTLANSPQTTQFDDVDYQLSDMSSEKFDKSISFPLEHQERHLFSDSLLTYDPDYMNKVDKNSQLNRDNDEEKRVEPRFDAKVKTWLKDRIDSLIKLQEDAIEKKTDDESELVEKENEHQSSLPKLNANEVYLPIDIEHLVPKKSVKKNVQNFGFSHHGKRLKSTVAPTVVLSSSTTPITNPSTTTLSPSSTSVPTTAPTTAATVLTTPRSSNSSNSTKFSPTLKPRRLGASFAALKNVSFDAPERRILTTYPMRRLMMAYFAPRILKFQAAMVMSTLLSEVSRKVLDPLVGNFVGSNLMKALPTNAPKATTTTPASILSSLSSITGNSNSLASLAQLTPLLGGLLNSGQSSPPTEDRSSLIAEESRVQEDSLSSIVGTLNKFNPSELQALTQIISSVDSKQLNSLISLAQTISPLLKSTVGQSAPTTTTNTAN